MQNTLLVCYFFSYNNMCLQPEMRKHVLVSDNTSSQVPPETALCLSSSKNAEGPTKHPFYQQAKNQAIFVPTLK